MNELHVRLAAGVCGMFASVAFAQNTDPGAQTGPGTKPPMAFAALDLDADGKISRTEAKGDALLLNNFDVLDLDKDDHLSQLEYAASQNIVGRLSL